MKQIEKNKEALQKFTKGFGRLPEYELRDNPHNIHALRTIYGFKCVACSKDITYLNLKFYDYREYTKCYSCQEKRDDFQREIINDSENTKTN